MKFTVTVKHAEMTEPDSFEVVGLTAVSFDTFEAAYSYGVSQMNLGLVSLNVGDELALHFDLDYHNWSEDIELFKAA